MAEVIIPFTPLPKKLVLAWSKKLIGAQAFFAALFPELKESLAQSNSALDAREYTAAALFVAVTNAALVFALVQLLGFAGRVNLFSYAVLFTVLVFAVSFASCIFYPRILARRRARAIGVHLIPAIRQILIELRSGVPLFNALGSVCDDYGEVSKIFRKIVQRINAGVSDVDALLDAAREAPSPQLQKVLWQVSNALKVGSDVGNALEAMALELEKEKVDEIRRYGQELAPWTMLYMIAAIILPSIGIAMLIVLTSFFDVALPKIALPGVLALLVLFQLFFLNFVSTRRPTV